MSHMVAVLLDLLFLPLHSTAHSVTDPNSGLSFHIGDILLPGLPRLPRMELVANGTRSSQTEIPNGNFSKFFKWKTSTVSHSVNACTLISAFQRSCSLIPRLSCLERLSVTMDSSTYSSLRASAFLYVTLSYGLTMAKKQDLDICIIGMNDTRTASMLCMEDHACVIFFVTAL